jgi:hypothetical protein
LTLVVDDQVQLWFDVLAVVLGHGANEKERAERATMSTLCKPHGVYTIKNLCKQQYDKGHDQENFHLDETVDPLDRESKRRALTCFHS